MSTPALERLGKLDRLALTIYKRFLESLAEDDFQDEFEQFLIEDGVDIDDDDTYFARYDEVLSRALSLVGLAFRDHYTNSPNRILSASTE